MMFLGLVEMDPHHPNLVQPNQINQRSRKKSKVEISSNHNVAVGNDITNNDNNDFMSNDNDYNNDKVRSDPIISFDDSEIKTQPSSFVYFIEQLVATNRVQCVRIDDFGHNMFQKTIAIPQYKKIDGKLLNTISILIKWQPQHESKCSCNHVNTLHLYVYNEDTPRKKESIISVTQNQVKCSVCHTGSMYLDHQDELVLYPKLPSFKSKGDCCCYCNDENPNGWLCRETNKKGGRFSKARAYHLTHSQKVVVHFRQCSEGHKNCEIRYTSRRWLASSNLFYNGSTWSCSFILGCPPVYERA